MLFKYYAKFSKSQFMKYLAKSTTLILPIVTNILLFTVPQITVRADEIYVDKECNYNPDLERLERFTVFYNSEFISNEQTYWLYAGRYQDGAVLLCVSLPDYLEPQPLNLPDLQFNFIDSVTKQTDSDRTFIIEVRKGNGFSRDNTSFSQFYQIDLTNLEQPAVQEIDN
jgi:hypothetical protein